MGGREEGSPLNVGEGCMTDNERDLGGGLYEPVAVNKVWVKGSMKGKT